MTNLELFHVKTIKNGQADDIDRDTHSRVHHDSSTYYYNFEGLNVSQDDFKYFVETAFDAGPYCDRYVVIETRNVENCAYSASIEYGQPNCA